MDDSLKDFFVSRLVMDKVTLSDAGMYICVAKPAEGQTSFKYAYLKIKKAEKANTEDKLIIIVACLGALILVFLILLVAFVCRRHSKPSISQQSQDANESRERMLTEQSCKTLHQHHHPNAIVQVPVQEYFAPVWTSPSTLNPKQGLPLPPTPVENRGRNGHQSPQGPNRHPMRHHHHRR